MNRRPIAIALLAFGALVFLACGGASGKGSETTTAPPARDGAVAAASGAWTTFGGGSARSGVAHGAPVTPSLQRRFARSLDGEVYAQPLIAGGRIYVATENNSVYAFTTSGRQLWRRHLGAPVPGGDLPCGNIDPSGITGTPVISRGRLFAVAFLRSGHRHVLFGLRLSSGRVAVRARVDPANRLVEQQRGALLVAHGRLYVPYGGLFGDCGPYRGFVISTTTSGGHRITYRNPATEAGIWAPAGISAQAGTLLVGTGNGGAGAFGYQNSVIRLSPGLRRLGYWAPRDWRALSDGDVDEGSLAPLPVTGGRVLQIGKNGVGYLLGHGLGGVGAEQFSKRLCGGGAFGAAAFRAPLAIVPCGGSLYGLRIEGASFSVAWSSAAGGVPVIAGNSVFSLTRDGTLVQLRLRDGHRIAAVHVGSGATSFPAPAAAGRLLVAPAGRSIVAFGL
ncbi:MAG TPA: PQQ-binding-like beta-propeller repeat protein [Solirubrobacteraceae bacterium]|nr:PQQ-binding-like beta-propeller repeat protein [Solirubrobacteraceae bacterium]